MLSTMWHLHRIQSPLGQHWFRNLTGALARYLDLLKFLLELFVFTGLVLYDQGDHCPRPLQACSRLLVGRLLNVLTIHLRGKREKEEEKEKREREKGEGRRERKKRERKRRGREREKEKAEGEGERENGGRMEGEKEKKKEKERRGGRKVFNSIVRRGST